MAGDKTMGRWAPAPVAAPDLAADFYSDTATRPSPAMLAAVAAAACGDEQRGEDPTTNALCARAAELLGKEAAVFLPSGTMCNEIALRVHCRPGDEIICERSTHIVNFEGGGPAALSGIMIQALDGDRGRLCPEQVAAAIREPSRYGPETRLVAVEQTANLGGGAVWPVAQLDAVAAVARDHGLATHMDGARLLNAAIASGRSARDHAAGYDSCWIDFTKGLGGFCGAVLAGSAEFIDRAWRIKQQWGGGLRQSGVIAASCLHALDHHVERLAEDHALAAHIAARLAQMPGVAGVLPVETNIIIFDLDPAGPGAAQVVQRLLAHRVRVGVFGPHRIRAVTHLDVNMAGADLLCRHLPEALAAS